MLTGFRYYNVSIHGLAPGMLMSNGQMADPENFYHKRVMELSNKTAAGEEIERQRIKYHITGRLYVNAQRRIVIPNEMISSTLRKGASAVSAKNGRKWWAGITVMDDAPLIVDGLPEWDKLHEEEVFVHRCMAVGANKVPQPRYRPYFRQWSATIPIELDPSAIDAATLKVVCASAGKSAGFGDWRPSSPKNPGKYGRFVVDDVTEIAQETPCAA